MNVDDSDSSEEFQKIEDLLSSLPTLPVPMPVPVQTGIYHKVTAFSSSVTNWLKPPQNVELQLHSERVLSPSPANSGRMTDQLEETSVQILFGELQAQEEASVDDVDRSVTDDEQVQSILTAESLATITSASSISSLREPERTPTMHRDSSSSKSSWDMPNNITSHHSVESALLWCLTPAIYGIRSIGVLSAADRAARLVAACAGDTNGAVVLAAGGETGGVKRSRIIFEFLVRQVPFVGCPAYVLTSTWTHLRAVATIAAIYGHDLKTARTQHEILWCLIPQQKPREEATPTALTATAKSVASSLVSSAIARSTGITVVSELFQLGTDLWSTKNMEEEEEFECLSLGPSATARHYFCPDNSFNRAKLGFIAFGGVVLPYLYRIPSIFSVLLCLVSVLIFSGRKKISVPKFFPVIFSYLVFSVHALLPVVGIANGITILTTQLFLEEAQISQRVSLFVLGLLALTGGLKSINSAFDSIHIEIRKLALCIALFAHVLPLCDRSGEYTRRLAFLVSQDAGKSLHYISVIASSTFQNMLISQLKRREVVLTLLGAERVMVLSLTLFFRGISAAVHPESLLFFFQKISPNPLFCGLIMTVREHTVWLAILVCLCQGLPGWTAAWQSMLFGILAGILVVAVLWNNWRLHENMYLSHLRLLHVLPGTITETTRSMVDGLILSSGKSALKSVIVQLAKKWMAKFFLRKVD